MSLDENKEIIRIPESLKVSLLNNRITLTNDCGTCQAGGQACGTSQTGPCDFCQGLGGCQTCQICQPAYENCKTACQLGTSCQDEGESVCSTTCENVCQTACQKTSQCSESSLIDPTWSLSATTDTITARITNKGSYSYFSWSLRDASNNIISGATSYSTATSKTYSGLAPGTTYIVYMSWSRSTNGEGNYDSDSITTDEVSGVTPWSWNASNGTASAVQTRTAYNAVSNYGPISDFSYLVWNDMVTKVAEMRNRANQKPVWNTKYLTQANTSMSNTESGRTMTAARYNSLRYNIGLYYGFNEVPSGELIDLDSVTKEKIPGDPVIGSNFIDLMTGLNYAIDRANNS